MRKLFSRLLRIKSRSAGAVEGYRCPCCDKWHEGLPFSYFFPFPAQWSNELERDDKSRLGDETCVIRDEFFYVKGNIDIPVLDQPGIFAWTVWVSLSRDDFERAGRLWEEPARVKEPPYFGWLSTRLPAYPDTLSLKTNVHWREVGIRPYIELEPTDHPLAVEQRNGITLARVREIAALALHGTQEK